MAKIDFAPGDLQKLQEKVDALLKGQNAFPFQVTFSHSYKRGVVLPRAGRLEIIPKDEGVVLTVNSKEQAFDICSDIAYLAGHYKIDKFGTLTTADKPVAKEPSTEGKTQ